MIKKLLYILMVSSVLLACNSDEVNKPQISFVSMTPSDTLKRNEELKIVLSLKDVNGNVDSFFYNKIYTDLEDTLMLSQTLPESGLLVRDGEITLSLFNTQLRQGSNVLNDPEPKRDYNTKFQIWVKDKQGLKSNIIYTPILHVKVN